MSLTIPKKRYSDAKFVISAATALSLGSSTAAACNVVPFMSPSRTTNMDSDRIKKGACNPDEQYYNCEISQEAADFIAQLALEGAPPLPEFQGVPLK
jgi:hypothetical protein